MGHRQTAQIQVVSLFVFGTILGASRLGCAAECWDKPLPNFGRNLCAHVDHVADASAQIIVPDDSIVFDVHCLQRNG